MPEKLVTPRRYENPQDVKQRLDNTWVRYKGDVVKCHYYDGMSVQVYLISDPTHSDILVNSSSVDLDISSIRVGFMADRRKTAPMIIRRAPVRRYKQGICVANLEAVLWNGPGEDVTVYQERQVTSLSQREEFTNMLLDKYPTVEHAIGYMKSTLQYTENMFSCAISKDFCFCQFKGKIYLLDNGFEEVGVFNTTTNRLDVNAWWATPTMMDYLRGLGVPLAGE